MSEQTIPIPGRLKNVAIGGHVAGSEDIDAGEGKTQKQVNDETNDTLALHQSEINGLNSQNYVSVSSYSSLPATGSADTIYRVSSYDGTQVDATKYAEYAWNGSAYVLLDVKTQVGEVFDISQYKAVGGTLATFEDLSAALDGGNNIPVGVRKGGMSIKFVQSSDNKYVQTRCMAQNFTTDVTQWQGVDVKPIEGSQNLVESGGVSDELSAILYNIGGSISQREQLIYNSYIVCNGAAGSVVDLTPVNSADYMHTVVECEEGELFYLTGQGGTKGRLWCFIDANNKIISKANAEVTQNTVLTLTTPTNAVKLIYNIAKGFGGLFTSKPSIRVEENNGGYDLYIGNEKKIGAINKGYQYLGIATPQTTPDTSVKGFYLAQKGTYPNFDNITIPYGDFGIFKFDGSSWSYSSFSVVNSAKVAYSLDPKKIVITGGELKFNSMWASVNNEWKSIPSKTMDLSGYSNGLYFIYTSGTDYNIVVYNQTANVDNGTWCLLGILYITSGNITDIAINSLPLREGSNNSIKFNGQDLQHIPTGQEWNSLESNVNNEQKTLITPTDIYVIQGEDYDIYKRSVEKQYSDKCSIILSDEQKGLNADKEHIHFEASSIKDGNIYLYLNDQSFSYNLYRNKIVKHSAVKDTSSKKICLLGDSIFQNWMADCLIEYSTDKGLNFTSIGTIANETVLGEGRGGWDSSNLIGANNRIPNIAQPIVMWESGTHNTKKNPFIRVATAQDLTDNPDWCFVNTGSEDTSATKREDNYTTLQDNTKTYYIFDWAHYIDVVDNTPDYVVYAFSINDYLRKGYSSEVITTLLGNIEFAIKRILEVAPNTKIAIMPVNCTYSYYYQNIYEGLIDRVPLYDNLALSIKEDYSNSVVDILGTWPFLNRVGGYSDGAQETILAGQTKVATNWDRLHPSRVTTYQAAKIIAAWINYR